MIRIDPDPHCRIGKWHFKPDYERRLHLGPITRARAIRRAAVNFALMRAMARRPGQPKSDGGKP